jgi:tetratricopeptide (TPR) repeat protein
MAPAVANGPAHVRVWSRAAGTLLEYDTPLAIPKVDAPDLTKKPAVTADELYEEAYLLDSQSNPGGAREGYQKALAADPGHVKTLCALAVLDNEQGRYAEAEANARKAAEKDAHNGGAWYQAGIACLHQARFEEARAAFKKALETNPKEGYNCQYLAAVALKLSPGREAASLASDMDEADLTNTLTTVIRGLAKKAPEDCALRAGMLGPNAGVAVLDAAAFLADLGLHGKAAETIGRIDKNTSFFQDYGPYPDYCRAYYLTRTGKGGGEKYLDRGTEQPLTRFFPHGTHALEVLQWAVKERPEDAKAQYLLGITLAGLHRTEEALPCWEKAAQLDPKIGQAWRLLGLHYWKKGNDLNKAEGCYRLALAALPNDQIVLRDLTEVLTALNRRPEAILLAEQFPTDVLKRYDLGLWLGKAYADEKRYDDCIAFLGEARFSNWEGVTTPRDTWVGALVERGKQRFEAGRNEEALADFQTALTYPANLGVGQRYKRTDAEVCYWNGRVLQALGRTDDARKMWQEGASQLCAADPPATFITVTPAQDEHVKKCKEALEAPAK